MARTSIYSTRSPGLRHLLRYLSRVPSSLLPSSIYGIRTFELLNGHSQPALRFGTAVTKSYLRIQKSLLRKLHHAPSASRSPHFHFASSFHFQSSETEL